MSGQPEPTKISEVRQSLVREAHAGKLEANLVGDRVMITRESLEKFIAALPPREVLVEWFVYFARFGEAGPIKIGFASDVAKRIGQLQVSAPEQIYLLGSIPGTVKDEARLHTNFDKYYIRGEWFRPEPELLDYIDGLKK